MAKRSRVELMYDMLKAIEQKGGSIKRTHLLYKANLSHDALKRYLKELMDGHLVEETTIKKERRYVLTEKGFKFLQEYQRFQDFSDAFGI